MAKEEKKSVALELSVYAKLSKLAADLRAANPGGGFVSMSAAVGVLLDAYTVYSELKATQEEDWNQELISKSRGYCEEPVSLQTYAANAEANDPQYLEPENETE